MSYSAALRSAIFTDTLWDITGFLPTWLRKRIARAAPYCSLWLLIPGKCERYVLRFKRNWMITASEVHYWQTYAGLAQR